MSIEIEGSTHVEVTCRLANVPPKAALIIALSRYGQVLPLDTNRIRLIPYEVRFPEILIHMNGEIRVRLKHVFLEEVMQLLMQVAQQLHTNLVFPGDEEQPARGRSRAEPEPPIQYPTEVGES